MLEERRGWVDLFGELGEGGGGFEGGWRWRLAFKLNNLLWGLFEK